MKSGIYKILNTKNSKFYIGSTDDLHERYMRHWRDLRGHRHHNNHLQSAWLKDGEDSFSFIILEYIETNNLLEREQWWIDETKCLITGYNICPKAGSSKGYQHSENTRKKLSLKGIGNKNNSKPHVRTYNQSFKAKLVYRVDSAGNIVVFRTAAEAAKSIGLGKSWMSTVALKEKMYKGYKWTYNEISALHFKKPATLGIVPNPSESVAT